MVSDTRRNIKMKQSLTLALIVLCVNLSFVQSDESPEDSFQTSLTNFLSSLFGYNKDNTTSTTSSITSTTTTTMAPAMAQTNNALNGTTLGNATIKNATSNSVSIQSNNTVNGTTLGNATVTNSTSNPVSNQTLNASAAIPISAENQTLNASELNHTVIGNGTQLSVEKPPTNVTNVSGSTSTTTPGYSSTLPPSTTSYSPSYSSTFRSYSTSSMYSSEGENNGVDKLCYKPTVVSNFCSAPSDLTDVSFWDLYSAVFSDAVIDGLLMGCARGTWCLKDKYDYWDALIAERVDIVMNSQILTSVCEPGVISCIDRMAEFFNNCSFYYQMTYTSNVLDLVCDLRRNNQLAQACYKHVIEALHVTLADLVREESQPEDYEFSSPEEECKTPEAFMTQGLICVVNSCPGEENTFKNFKPWLWFTEEVDKLIETCSYNITECVALLQRPLNYVGSEDLQMMITISTATMVTAVFLSLTVCLCYRRYRRNAVIKDGYQQLLNDGEES